MHSEINTDIHLMGFQEDTYRDLLNQLKKAGFSGKLVNEDLILCNTEKDTQFPAVFLLSDNVIKPPQTILNSLSSETLNNEIPVVILTETYDEEREKEFIKNGAYDYLDIEEITPVRLKRVIQKTLLQFRIFQQKSTSVAELIKKEEKFRLIAENSQDLIAVLAPGLFYEYVSPSAKTLLGYEPEEVYGKTPFQIFIFEDFEKITSKHPEDQELDKYHYRIKHKNGEFIWFETCIKPYYDESGNIIQLLTTSKNITKRKRLTFMLEEMQHLARVGAWEYYLEKDKIYATGEVSKIFGTDKDRDMGLEEILRIFTSTSQKMIERELGQTLEYGKSWDLELSFYNNKNQIQWVRTVGQAYFMNGKPYKLGGTVQDISERINYEEQLYKKQSELKAFVENTPAAIAMFDKNMNYIAATNQWCEDFGIPDRNIVGQTHEDIFPKSTSSWKKIREQCLNGSVVKKEEDKILFSNGKVEWLKWEVRPWYSHKNEIGGLIAMSEIITSRKEEEEHANQQQKRMREIYQITSDITGDIGDRIKKVIEKATIALGMDQGIFAKIVDDKFIVKDCYDISHSVNLSFRSFPLDSTLCNITYGENGVVSISDLSQSPYAYHPTVASIPTASYIGVPVWKSGVKYGTLSFSAVHSYKDEFSQADQDFVQLLGQWIGAAIDRRTFEKELVVAKEKAEEASKTKAQFVSTMSHEIRTPLNAVVGITHLLLEQDPKESQIKNLNTLQFSANNLLALINDILDFSKIESGKIEIEEIEYDIREMLQGLFSILEYKATEKSIDLTMNISPSLPNNLKGDPIRLNQILTNLLSNAIKFTDIGGVNLTVDILEETEEEIHVKFVVTDTGIGIARDKLENIFESFTQASTDTSRKYGGTGLGLSISKKLAEVQGGQIKVESTVGKGSVFTLLIKLEKAASQAQKKKILDTAIEVDVSGSYILLVEDNEVNQMVANQFLQRKGIQTDCVKNGLQALEKIRSKKYQLVLMDLQMPEMDGYEAARKIRSFSGSYFKEVPIIALTASTMSEVRKQVMASGMNDYISKPFVPRTFYDCIDKYLNKAYKQQMTTEADDTNTHIEFDKVLDFAYGEKSFYLELLTKIKLEIATFNEQFIEAVEERNLEKIGFLKHRLTSSLKILGLTELDDHIEEVRAVVSNNPNDEDALLPLVRKVDMLCKNAVQDMASELAKA